MEEQALLAVKYIAVVIIALVCAAGASIFYRYYRENKVIKITELLKANKKATIFFAVLFVVFGIAETALYVHRKAAFTIIVERQIMWYALAVIAVIDWKMKKIPNKMILFLFAERTIFIILSIIQKPSEWLITIGSSALGMVVGGFVVLICLLLSRGGIGAGDLKLFAAIGYFYGLAGVMSIMMYSLFIAALVSIGLLISKKAKAKSTIPMAPFILVGTSIFFIFS